MSRPGLWVFIAFMALAVAGGVVHVQWAHRWAGGVTAAKTAVVLAASATLYAITCLIAGFGASGQVLGCVLSAAPLAIGRNWLWVPPGLPPLTRHHDKEDRGA